MISPEAPPNLENYPSATGVVPGPGVISEQKERNVIGEDDSTVASDVDTQPVVRPSGLAGGLATLQTFMGREKIESIIKENQELKSKVAELAQANNDLGSV